MRVHVEPERPNPRKLQPAVDALKRGQVIVYPTDTGYAFGCALSSVKGITAIRKLKGLDEKSHKPLTMIVTELSEVGRYGVMSNSHFRLIRRLLPGPYTLILKASAGGGGRGMKIIRDMRALPSTLELAQVEAFKAFGCGDMYLERYVTSPRHVEVQVIADKHGDAIHLLERECSVQRRHQKVIEEAPCSVLSDELRAEMCATAVKASKAINYHSLGTFEFLLDGDRFYFMEMNTRVQVEHCVTEMITGIDLVRAQLEIAQGERLKDIGLDQASIPKPRGMAIQTWRGSWVVSS